MAIAEEGIFTAAAIRLPPAQSALSRQISEMEDALGVQTFDRSRDRSTLTDAGQSLLRFARELLQTRIEIVNAIQAIQQASLHQFKIGFTPFVDQHIIGAVCSAYREIFPRALVAPQNGDHRRSDRASESTGAGRSPCYSAASRRWIRCANNHARVSRRLHQEG